MSTRLISLVLLSFIFIVFTSEMLSDNGRAGYTGSPGESKCNNCHSSYALNSGGGSAVLTSNMVNWQYEPGYTYDITLTVSRTGNSLFGMGLEALTSTNNNAGTLVVTNTHTQIKTKTVSTVVRNNMVHTLNGGSSPNSMAFTFQWVAPSSNIGNVTMYFCGVAANHNGSESLDYVYNSSQVITPMVGTSISVANEQNLFSVYPNPTTDVIHVATDFQGTNSTRVQLYDQSGKLIQEHVINGQKDDVFDVSTYPKGVYFILAENGDQRYSRKLLIQ